MTSDLSLFAFGQSTVDTVVKSASSVRRLGGACAYFGAGAASVGSRVGVVTVVSRELRTSFETIFSSCAIDTQGVQLVDAPQDEVTLEYEGERLVDVRVRFNASQALDAASVPTAYWKAKAVHICPAPLAGQRAVAIEARRRGLFVSFDPHADLIGADIDTIASMASYVDLFGANESEFAGMFPSHESLEKSAIFLHDCGVKVVVILMGEKGAVIYERGRRYTINPYQTSGVVDPVGAGDLFLGVLVAQIISGVSVDSGGACASRLAAESISEQGIRGFEHHIY